MSNRKVYVYDKIQGKMVELKDRYVEHADAPYVIDDSMPLLKSPLSRTLYFDSKRALRAHYKQHGVEEVGNEYERGYDPGAERQREVEKRVDAKIKQNLIDRLYHGKR